MWWRLRIAFENLQGVFRKPRDYRAFEEGEYIGSDYWHFAGEDYRTGNPVTDATQHKQLVTQLRRAYDDALNQNERRAAIALGRLIAFLERAYETRAPSRN